MQLKFFLFVYLQFFTKKCILFSRSLLPFPLSFSVLGCPPHCPLSCLFARPYFRSRKMRPISSRSAPTFSATPEILKRFNCSFLSFVVLRHRFFWLCCHVLALFFHPLSSEMNSGLNTSGSVYFFGERGQRCFPERSCLTLFFLRRPGWPF